MMPEAPNTLLLVGARADSCVFCVLCRVFMIRTAALAKIKARQKKLRRQVPAKRKYLCRELLPVAATEGSTVPSSHCDAATSPGRATARRVAPHCVRAGFCPCRRLAGTSEPTQGKSPYHQSPRSISRPCSPSPPQQHRRRCGGPISRGPSPRTFLSGSKPVYRNTGSCFLQRATPCR